MPTNGNSKFTIRMEDEPRARFTTTARIAGSHAAEITRRMIAWWMREPGATLPPRPAAFSAEDPEDPAENAAGLHALNSFACEHWADQVHGVARDACNWCLASALVKLGWTPPPA